MSVMWYSYKTCCSEFKTHQNYKQFYSNIRRKFMNFENESLSVDYITLNLKNGKDNI